MFAQFKIYTNLAKNLTSANYSLQEQIRTNLKLQLSEINTIVSAWDSQMTLKLKNRLSRSQKFGQRRSHKFDKKLLQKFSGSSSFFFAEN